MDMLIDQIIGIKSNEQPKETTIRYAPIEQLRMMMTRIEHAYGQSEPGTVLLHALCDDITLMIPVEKPAIVASGTDSDEKIGFVRTMMS